MAEAPQIFIVFCEGLREEVGNKSTLLGLFGPEVFYPEGTAGSFTTVVLCRLFGPDPLDGKFSIRFEAGDDGVTVPTPINPIPVHIDPPENWGVWTTQVAGTFVGLPIHDGMRVIAAFKAANIETSAPLTFRYHDGEAQPNRGAAEADRLMKNTEPRRRRAQPRSTKPRAG